MKKSEITSKRVKIISIIFAVYIVLCFAIYPSLSGETKKLHTSDGEITFLNAKIIPGDEKTAMITYKYKNTSNEKKIPSDVLTDSGEFSQGGSSMDIGDTNIHWEEEHSSVFDKDTSSVDPLSPGKSKEFVEFLSLNNKNDSITYSSQDGKNKIIINLSK